MKQSCSTCTKNVVGQATAVKHGWTATGKQRYRCRGCGRTFQSTYSMADGYRHNGDKLKGFARMRAFQREENAKKSGRSPRWNDYGAGIKRWRMNMLQRLVQAFDWALHKYIFLGRLSSMGINPMLQSAFFLASGLALNLAAILNVIGVHLTLKTAIFYLIGYVVLDQLIIRLLKARQIRTNDFENINSKSKTEKALGALLIFAHFVLSFLGFIQTA